MGLSYGRASTVEDAERSVNVQDPGIYRPLEGPLRRQVSFHVEEVSKSDLEPRIAMTFLKKDCIYL